MIKPPQRLQATTVAFQFLNSHNLHGDSAPSWTEHLNQLQPLDLLSSSAEGHLTCEHMGLMGNPETALPSPVSQTALCSLYGK